MNFSARSAKVLIPLVVVAFASAMAPAMADSSNGDGQKSSDGQKSGVVYNSVISPLPGNLPSYGFESVAFNEFGNAVNFATSGTHNLSKVVVTMSSWGCQSGGWTDGTCVTSEDATFSQPITLNIYSPSTDGGANPGRRLASITKTFDIKYRPSASPRCFGGDRGKWYDESAKACFNGLAQNITFKVEDVSVGSSAIFGIAYNTSNYGFPPIGSAACQVTSAGCPYDSLNVAVTQDPTDVTVGSSVVPGKLWLNSPSKLDYADAYKPYDPAYNYAPYYGFVPLADLTNVLFGTFRMDSPNAASWWGLSAPYSSAPWYVPAIQVFATGQGKANSQTPEKKNSTHAEGPKVERKISIKQD